MSRLSDSQQERVAQALLWEFGPTLNVTIEAARKQVAAGLWDDHPAAGMAFAQPANVNW